MDLLAEIPAISSAFMAVKIGARCGGYCPILHHRDLVVTTVCSASFRRYDNMVNSGKSSGYALNGIYHYANGRGGLGLEAVPLTIMNAAILVLSHFASVVSGWQGARLAFIPPSALVTLGLASAFLLVAVMQGRRRWLGVPLAGLGWCYGRYNRGLSPG